MIYRLSVAPDSPWKDKDLPGCEAILFVRAVVQHPAELAPSLPLPLFERINGEADIAFTIDRTLGVESFKLSRKLAPTDHCARCHDAESDRSGAPCSGLGDMGQGKGKAGATGWVAQTGN
jgi:hypothetical protein